VSAKKAQGEKDAALRAEKKAARTKGASAPLRSDRRLSTQLARFLQVCIDGSVFFTRVMDPSRSLLRTACDTDAISRSAARATTSMRAMLLLPEATHRGRNDDRIGEDASPAPSASRMPIRLPVRSCVRASD